MHNVRQENVCETSLQLGLSLSTDHHRQREPTSKSDRRPPLVPSLSLSFSDDLYANKKRSHEGNSVTVSSPTSAFSSFSTACWSVVRKEKVVAGEEDRASSRASDEDEEGGARKKLRLTKEQSALLENWFKEHSTLNPKQKQALAKQLNLRPRQVEVWFQNRRARTKFKQTEVDCEFLKRCCETLTGENRRLQKELQELKARRFGQPVYMQLPAATLSVCPSCERVTGANGGTTSGNSSFVAAQPKPHFFNPFTHPAAC